MSNSRTSRALLNASLTYGGLIISISAAFFVTPIILQNLSARQYGLWLSSGELIGYLLLLDFGVFSILPWLIARADGEKNLGQLKHMLVHGGFIALVISGTLIAIAATFWGAFPSLLGLTPTDWHSISGPLCLLVAFLAVNLPLNLFTSISVGLQDVRFYGSVNLIKAALGPALTVGLLLSGHGLFALALGTGLLSPLGGVAAFVRVRRNSPDLLRSWPRPTVGGALLIFRESIGPWLAGAGVQMMQRSSAVVLTFLGNPAAVPTLVCTSRVGQMLTQMSWVMPDSALVGFAQMGGENKPERLREVALSIIRLNLVFACGAACLVLALNPAFVRIWVTERFFGGTSLNMLLALEVICGSATHAFASVVAVQGNRLAIGIATLCQGAIFIVLAFALTRHFRLEGLLAASLIAPLLSTVPVSLWHLRSSLRLSLRRISKEVLITLVFCASPCLVAAWAYGLWREKDASLLELAGVGILFAATYVKLMGPQIATFPLPLTAKFWLGRLRLI